MRWGILRNNAASIFVLVLQKKGDGYSRAASLHISLGENPFSLLSREERDIPVCRREHYWGEQLNHRTALPHYMLDSDERDQGVGRCPQCPR
jgi:hypothetical protein